MSLKEYAIAEKDYKLDKIGKIFIFLIFFDIDQPSILSCPGWWPERAGPGRASTKRAQDDRGVMSHGGTVFLK